MNHRNLLVVGATGDVGQGLVAAALESGRTVVAASRSAEKLRRLADRCPGLRTVTGSLETEAAAGRLWEAAAAAVDGLDAVAVSVNAPNAPAPLRDLTAEDIAQVHAANLLTHFNAVRAFVPHLPPTGLYVGVGGGMADFVAPGLAHLSMAQAALRMMYRGFAREHREGPLVRELLIASMVNGQSKRERAEDSWITDIECGRHLCAVLDDVAAFDAPIITLRSREQVGKPDKAAA
jgi:NAD(P)-dependent dehydrogenase (short-subunit alcohol dehydrogenase family)